jgi:WD40 repeat protein
VLHAAFSPDGRLVTSAGEDCTAQVWYPRTGERLGRPLQHRSAIKWVAFSPDGRRVATGSDDNTARAWEAATGLPLTPPLRHNGTVNQAVFGRDGRHLVTAGDDGIVRVWELGPGEAGQDAPAGREIGSGLTREGTPPPKSPDGGRVIRIEGAGARVWDTASGEPVTPPLAHASRVVFADFSPDGHCVVTCSDDDTARVWDAATGELLLAPLQHQGTVLHASFRRDGKCLVTASADGTARVWDATTGEPLTPPLRHHGAVRRALFSSDGRRVLTAEADGTTRSWSLDPDGRPVEDLEALAQLLAGTAIDAKRSPMPVEGPQLLRTWEALRNRYPEDFTSTPAQARPAPSR